MIYTLLISTPLYLASTAYSLSWTVVYLNSWYTFLNNDYNDMIYRTIHNHFMERLAIKY